MSLIPSLIPRLVHRPLLAVAAAGLAATALAGCGSSSTPSSTSASGEASTPSTPASSAAAGDSASESPSTVPSPTPVASPSGVRPACSDIWVAGKRLPFRYTGCAEGGTNVPANAYKCESGQQLVAYQDTFWAVRNGPIMKSASVKSDPKYLAARRTCTG